MNSSHGNASHGSSSLKKIGAPQVKLLVREQIPKFVQVHEPANHCVHGGRLNVGMGYDPRGADDTERWVSEVDSRNVTLRHYKKADLVPNVGFSAT